MDLTFNLEVDRSLFPVTANLIYLNHAAVSPLPRPVANAMRHYLDDAESWGSTHYLDWMAATEGVRHETARMTGCGTHEVALVKNTSEGIATVQMGFPWQPGDIVVAFVEEFPANYYCWKLLETKGCILRWLSIYDPLDKIEEACRGARLLAISWVNYLSGHRVDLAGIGEICRRHDVFFFLDAIQGLGAFPLDVKALGIHAFAADGHKWLLGPEGWGVLYIDEAWQDRIFPVEFGWTTVKNWADYASRDMTLRSDAGRYEPGTLNIVGSFGLQAGMKLLNDTGIGRIGHKVQALTDHLAQGIQALDCELMAPRSPSTGAGIVSFRKAGHASPKIVAALKSQRISAAPRQGWARFAPHFYQTIEEMDRVLAVLEATLKEK